MLMRPQDDELLRERLASLRGSALKAPAQPVVDSKGRAKATGRRKTCSAQVGWLTLVLCDSSSS